MSNKPMTIKEFNKRIGKYFYIYKQKSSLKHRPLCYLFTTSFFNSNICVEWEFYWRTINTYRYVYMSTYLEVYGVELERQVLLLRLLVVEDFKKHLINRGILI